MVWSLVIIIPILYFLDLKIIKFFFGLIFHDKEDFYIAVKYALRPDIISLFKGEYMRDRTKEYQLSIFLGIVAAVIGLEAFVIYGIFFANM